MTRVVGGAHAATPPLRGRMRLWARDERFIARARALQTLVIGAHSIAVPNKNWLSKCQVKSALVQIFVANCGVFLSHAAFSLVHVQSTLAFSIAAEGELK